MSGSTTENKVLRAKYHDWCSARLADSFLVLAPDEIYELAERASQAQTLERLIANGVLPPRDYAITRAAQADGMPAGVLAAPMVGGLPAVADPDSFRALVALVTEVLAERLNLPPFEEWVVEYERSPEKYDHELLGFWRESLERADRK